MKKSDEKAIRSILEETQSTMPYEPRLSVHRYKGGIVDGELLFEIPPGVSIDAVLFDIIDSLPPSSYWLSMGARYTVKGSDEKAYKKVAGMTDVSTSWQRANVSNISELALVTRHAIDKGMSRRFRRKAKQVYLRLRSGDHPDRGQ